jgi:hypothetical protein
MWFILGIVTSLMIGICGRIEWKKEQYSDHEERTADFMCPLGSLWLEAYLTGPR